MTERSDRPLLESSCLSDEEVAAWHGSAIDDQHRASYLNHLESCSSCMQLVVGSAAFEPQWQVGRYLIREPIGSGGLGVVLLGYDPLLKREVAIKMLQIATVDSQLQADLLTEARSLAAVAHANVVRVHDVGHHDGEIYIAMERVLGPQLDQWWNGRSIAERLQAMVGIANGLAAIHQAGIVHRDIKPSNVIIDSNGNATIVDLGLANSVEAADAIDGDGKNNSRRIARGSPEASPRAIAGTPGYIAPELTQGSKASFASDQFSFWRVVEQTFSSAELTPKSRRLLRSAIERGCSQHPEARFATMAAAGAALQRCFEPERGNSHRLSIIAACIAVIGVAGLWWFFRASPQVAAGEERCNPALVLPVEQFGVINQNLARVDVDASRLWQLLAKTQLDAAKLIAESCNAGANQDRVLATRQKLCAVEIWQRTLRVTASLAKARSPLAVRTHVDELASVGSLDSCSGAMPPATPAPPLNPAAASAAWQAIERAENDNASIPGRLQALTQSKPLIDQAQYLPVLAAWHERRAYWLMLAGNYKDCAKELEVAARFALQAGDDLRYAIAKTSALVAAEAIGEVPQQLIDDAQAAIARVSNRGLIATYNVALSSVSIRNGKLDQARQLLMTALANLEATTIAPHERQVAALQNLSVVEQFSGNLKAAQVALDRAAAIADQRYGKQSIEAQTVWFARAANLVYLRRFDEASASMAELSNQLKRAGGEPTSLHYNLALGQCQLALASKSSEIDAVCQGAIAIARKLAGPDSSLEVAPLIQIGQAKLRTDAKGALPVLQQALALAQKHAQSNPTDEPYALGLLALANKVVGNRNTAVDLAKAALPKLAALGQKDLVATLTQQLPELKQLATK